MGSEPDLRFSLCFVLFHGLFFKHIPGIVSRISPWGARQRCYGVDKVRKRRYSLPPSAWAFLSRRFGSRNPCLLLHRVLCVECLALRLFCILVCLIVSLNLLLLYFLLNVRCRGTSLFSRLACPFCLVLGVFLFRAFFFVSLFLLSFSFVTFFSFRLSLFPCIWFAGVSILCSSYPVR